jgi:hypothetical protein
MVIAFAILWYVAVIASPFLLIILFVKFRSIFSRSKAVAMLLVLAIPVFLFLLALPILVS